MGGYRRTFSGEEGREERSLEGWKRKNDRQQGHRRTTGPGKPPLGHCSATKQNFRKKGKEVVQRQPKKKKVSTCLRGNGDRCIAGKVLGGGERKQRLTP